MKLRFAAAVLLAATLLVLCFRQVDGPATWAALERAAPAWALAAVATNAAIPLLWALQWWLFLPRAAARPFRAVLGVTALMATLSNSVPMLIGQATGVHLLASRAGVGHATALSVLALDQLAEGLCKLSVVLALAWFTPLPAPVRGAMAVLGTAVALLLALVAVAAWSHGRMQGRLRAPRPRHPALAPVARFVADWAAGLEGARRPGIVAGGLALGLAMKGAEMGGILAVQAALGVELPLWSALAVLAAVNLSTAVSVSPGNVGVYEGSAFLAYRAFGVAPETALALALLQHVAYLIPMAGAGGAALLVKGWRSSRSEERTAPQAATARARS